MTSTGPTAAARASDADSGVLDEALGLLHRTGPEIGGGGLSNHGPMAAEALVAMDRGADVLPWVRGYLRRLDPPPAPWKPIARDAWQASLGDRRHAADWPRFFEIELRERPWPEVLDAWVQRLAPGLAAAAAHGVLRTAHAMRALAARDTPQRRAELAAGLGYWATRYQTLPASPTRVKPAARASLVEALAQLPRVPAEQRRGGLISESLRALDTLPAFAAAADAAPLEGVPAVVLSQACLAFARAYLADDGRELFAFIHAVTGPSALRLLLPHLGPATQRAALREAWRLGAAVYSAFGRSAPALGPDRDAGAPPDRLALVEAAVATGDEHAIKLTEACLREHAVHPAPEFLTAARDVCRRFGARGI